MNFICRSFDETRGLDKDVGRRVDRALNFRGVWLRIWQVWAQPQGLGGAPASMSSRRRPARSPSSQKGSWRVGQAVRDFGWRVSTAARAHSPRDAQRRRDARSMRFAVQPQRVSAERQPELVVFERRPVPKRPSPSAFRNAEGRRGASPDFVASPGRFG